MLSNSTKQFCHYLLGRPFQLFTDHCPLQCLLSQKIEGLLCRSAPAQQEYDFTIKYHKGGFNNNADALLHSVSHSVSVATHMLTDTFKDQLHTAKQDDSIMKQVLLAPRET